MYMDSIFYFVHASTVTCVSPQDTKRERERERESERERQCEREREQMRERLFAAYTYNCINPNKNSSGNKNLM